MTHYYINIARQSVRCLPFKNTSFLPYELVKVAVCYRPICLPFYFSCSSQNLMSPGISLVTKEQKISNSVFIISRNLTCEFAAFHLMSLDLSKITQQDAKCRGSGGNQRNQIFIIFAVICRSV